MVMDRHGNRTRANAPTDDGARAHATMDDAARALARSDRATGTHATTGEGRTRSSRRPLRGIALPLVLAVGFTLGLQAAAMAAYVASPDELALLALTNEARADARLRPLVWHDGLGEAARVHSADMASNGCFQHDSCNGQTWSTRIGKYYPWLALGENIAMGVNDPRSLHEGWMASSGHRANILNTSFSEFGAGIVLAQTAFGKLAYATEDFGDRGMLPTSAIPTIPAGGVSPRLGLDTTRELFVNYYASSGAPEAVRALIGGACVDLPRTAGTATNGTYGIDYPFPSTGCVPVVFEAIRADGVRVRWPEGVALLVGVGNDGLACPDTTTDVPAQDCGGSDVVVDPTPTPTPGPQPTPTPAADPGDPSDLRVKLRPGKSAGAATVTLQATLPSVPGFDPSAAPVTVTIAPSGTTPWTTTIPVRCGDGSCLEMNARGTAFRGTVGTVSVGFTQTAAGPWKMRLTARKQTLGALRAGAIAVELSVNGTTSSTTTQGWLLASGALTN